MSSTKDGTVNAWSPEFIIDVAGTYNYLRKFGLSARCVAGQSAYLSIQEIAVEKGGKMTAERSEIF